MKDDELNAIVAKAADANAAQNVTGALAYNGRNFCQCLEGDEDTVRGLLQVIEQDPRHSGFKVIDEKQITDRYFEDWSMRLVDGLDFSVIINAMKA